MYARAGAGPPATATFFKNVGVDSGIESSCGRPTQPTTPPGRAILRAVSVDGSRPTHSRTEGAAKTIGQFSDKIDCLLPALTDYVCRAKLLSQGGPLGIAAEQDDLLGAQPLSRNHPAQSNRPVADDGNGRPRLNPGRHSGMMASAHHVCEGQKRRSHRIVGVPWQHDQRSV